jgi:hypothetical protein
MTSHACVSQVDEGDVSALLLTGLNWRAQAPPPPPPMPDPRPHPPSLQARPRPLRPGPPDTSMASGAWRRGRMWRNRNAWPCGGTGTGTGCTCRRNRVADERSHTRPNKVAHGVVRARHGAPGRAGGVGVDIESSLREAPLRQAPFG